MQQVDTLSNQTGSSLNFTLIICQKPFWESWRSCAHKIKIM